MAFPTIPTVAAGRVLVTTQANTTATRTFPSLSSLTKNSGDLLIAIIACYQTTSGTNAAFSSWGGSFTEFHDTATDPTLAMGAAYKWSTGSETGTFTVTQGATVVGHAAMILLSIPGAHLSTPPEAGSRANNSGANAADPASFNPAGWATEDTLWIAVAGIGETSTSGSFTGLDSAPTNFTNYAETAISADAVGGMQLAVAFRQNAVGAEDVGGFTLDTSNALNGAFVIAVRPAPGANAGASTGSIVWAGSATGARASQGAGSGSIVWAGSATGTTVRSGAASGSIVWAGSATGEAPVEQMEGETTGAITWAGSATGARASQGSATGAISWAGSVTGARESRGAASGAVTWAGSATGARTPKGDAAGAITRAGSATGARASQGSASGAISWAGSAEGEAPPEGATGSAEGAITWAGSATGTTTRSGASAGVIGWAGSATGSAPKGGTTSGAIDWAGSATGASALGGQAFGAITWAGLALGQHPFHGPWWIPDPVAHTSGRVEFEPAPVPSEPL